MGIYTTADRVRRAIGYSDPSLSNTALDEFIADTEAYIQRVTRTTYVPADGVLYDTAVGAATVGAAIRAIIIPLGGVVEGLDYTVDEIKISKSKQLTARLSTASQYRIDFRNYLSSLARDDTSVPVSNTQVYG